MKKNLCVILTILALQSLAIPLALAQGVVPAAAGDYDCDSAETKSAFKSQKKFGDAVETGKSRRQTISNLLGCAVKTGDIRLFMIPFFITYLIQLLLQLAGIISVMFIVIGGYYYVIAGISEEKDKGKKTILHAIVGLVIALSAWLIVNVIQVALTS